MTISRKLCTFALAMVTLLFTQACLDDDRLEPPQATVAEVQEFPEELGEDPHMLALARDIPGFGGFFFEPGTDRVVISMTGASTVGVQDAQQAVLATFATAVGPSSSMADGRPSEFVARVVEYSFLGRLRAKHREKVEDAAQAAIPTVLKRLRIS